MKLIDKTYTGILDEPLELKDGRLDRSILERKMHALFEHYGGGVDMTDPHPERLVLRLYRTIMLLALAHVPGFQLKQKRGRKKDIGAQLRLLGEMGRAMGEGRNIAAAIRHLTRPDGPYSGETHLRRRYDKARQNPVAVAVLDRIVRQASEHRKLGRRFSMSADDINREIRAVAREHRRSRLGQN